MKILVIVKITVSLIPIIIALYNNVYDIRKSDEKSN